jgi:hypothetical protein
MVQHISAEYGKSLITKETTDIGSYIVITMDIAWQLCRHLFQNNLPEQVVMVDTLDKEKLEEISEKLPKQVEIIGLGRRDSD